MQDQNCSFVETASLRIGYVERGPKHGWPVILSHGFPYDVHAFDDVAEILAHCGARVLQPYARGFGPTRFLNDRIMRSGQQAARGLDIVQFAEALALERPILAGFDWGGNASCVAAALWPDRVSGLVVYAGYDVIDLAGGGRPATPSLERICWYQHLFQTARGRACLAEARRDLCRILWQEWSPGWRFDQATFARSAMSFDNPDFVEVVIHCYRWMFGASPGDPAVQSLEDQLMHRPKVSVATVTLDGSQDPLKPGGTADHADMFVGPHEHRIVEAGHALPQEKPDAFAAAVLHVRDLAGHATR
jgi:pimeloyl-ACP methyl ester carboxylesterase